MRKFWIAAGAALCLTTQSVAAQDEEPSADELAMFAEMFAAEPLTAEQEARLPLANEVVAKLLPPGTLGEMMGEMFDSFLGPIMDMAGEASAESAIEQLGLLEGEVELSEEEAAEIIAIIDPAWEQRQQAQKDLMPAMMGKIMGGMEPIMRKAMAEMYAVYFNDGELTEIDAFFSTPTGASYARKSMTMSSDPRFLGAMMEAMPTMMGSFAEMEAEMKAAMESVPEPRDYDDLSVAERKRLSEITGLTDDDLSESMGIAAKARADSE